MTKLGIAVVLLAALGAAGCSSVSITPARIDSIKSVSVAPAVKVPDKAMYHGPEGAWATALGGAVGALIALGAVTAPEQIQAYLTREGIDVGEIARTQFVKGLQGDPR